MTVSDARELLVELHRAFAAGVQADGPDDAPALFSELRERFAERVARVGIVELLAAAFEDAENHASPMVGAIPALSPWWSRLRPDELTALIARVEAVPHGWYPLMWFCHRQLRVDYLDRLARSGLVDPAVVERRARHRPTAIELVPIAVEDRPEFEILADNGVDPLAFWASFA